MRVLILILLVGCFSKPKFVDGDGGTDAGDAGIDAPAKQLALTKISAGALHACAIDTDTRLWCWGDNRARQLGVADPPETATPQLISSDTGWTDVAAGTRHTCGIRNATVYCWGDNDRLQSAPGAAMGLVGITEVMLAETQVRAVFVGPETSCAIAGAESRLYCWGNVGLDGNLVGPTAATPTAVSDVAFGSEHACLIAGTATQCWGSNTVGQHGTGTAGGRAAFATMAMAQVGELVDIAASDEATCGLTAMTGRLFCWGSNARGHMRSVVQGQTPTPTMIDSDTSYAQVVMGQAYACLREGTTLSCHGDSGDGVLGHGQFSGSRSPVTPALVAATQIAGGERFACAIDGAQHLACWGSNKRGELAIGSIASKRSPVRAALPAGMYDEIVAGEDHTCALSSGGIVYCWGANTEAQVTGLIGSIERLPVAPTVPALRRLAAGSFHSCGVAIDGKLVCWGSNGSAQLGRAGGAGMNTLATSPAGRPWSTVAASTAGTCALDDMGRLICWGLIPGVDEPLLMQESIEPTIAYRSLAMGAMAAIAIRGDNSLRGFGQTCPLGLSGVDDILPTSALTVVPSVTGPAIVAIATGGGFHTCMHYTSGSPLVRCWGDNSANQVGATVQCTASEVKTIGTGLAMPADDVATVATGTAHSCAIDSTGVLHCWGLNADDTLGTLVATATPAPVPVGALRFSEVATSRTHTCAIAQDRTEVYCWGENRVGQLGDGTSFEATPVPAAFDPR